MCTTVLDAACRCSSASTSGSSAVGADGSASGADPGGSGASGGSEPATGRSASGAGDMGRPQARGCDVLTAEDCSLPPGSECVVAGFPTDSAFSGEAVLEPQVKDGYIVVPAVVHVQSGFPIPVAVRNLSDEHVTVPKGRLIGSLESHFEFSPDMNSVVVGALNTQSSAVDSVDLGESHLSPAEEGQFRDMLRQFSAMFDGRVGHTTLVEHRIKTGDSPPIKQSPRRVPPHLEAEVRKEIQDLIDKGIIEECDGAWASPVVCVRKSSGGLRICADMRKVNAVTEVPAYPVARIDDVLDALSGSSLFCVLDLNSGYNQMSVAEQDRDKTAICLPWGLYRYVRCNYGAAGAPSSFARLLNIVLKGLTPTTCLSYFDDIIVHGSSVSEVQARLKTVLSRLQEAGLTVNLQKCSFFRSRVTYLGHVISGEGVSPDPVKVQRVVEWPTPRSAKELASFLGLASYFRKYIPQFAAVAAPLYFLTQKHIQFNWSDAADAAFLSLKRLLTTAPVVAFPNFGSDAGEFILDTDASHRGVGGCLLQVDRQGNERVIAYGSKALTKAQRNYSTTKKELLAVVTFVNTFRHYLLGRRFKLRTDHSSLQWLVNFRDPQGLLARWIEILADYQFDIVHRAGSAHGDADALSRMPQPTADVACQTEAVGLTGGAAVCAVTPGDVSTESRACDVSTSSWSCSFLRDEQKKDRSLTEVIGWLERKSRPQRCSVSEDARPFFYHFRRLRLADGLVCRLFKRCPGSKEELQVVIPKHLTEGVLESMHAGAVRGHFNAQKLVKQVRLRFWWPGLEEEAVRFCRNCERCVTRNTPAPKPRASLGSLVATAPLQKVAIDLLTNLPETPTGNKHILVVIDHFTKWASAYPLQSQEATEIAGVLVNEFIAQFGVPESFHSDQGANFCGSVFTEMCRLLGIKKTQTSPGWPAGNGVCERVNKTILDMLSRHLDSNHSEWDRHLPLLLLAYRAQVHDSTGFSPYMMMMGREARLPTEAELGSLPRGTSSRRLSQYIDDLRHGLQNVHKLAFSSSQRAHERNKELYDRSTVEREYSAGDAVYLFRKVVRRGEYHKFVRPWKAAVVLSRVGDLNYRIKVESGRKVIVVHHNRLKPRSVRTQSAESEQRSTERPSPDAQVEADDAPVSTPSAVAGNESVWSPNPEVHFPLSSGCRDAAGPEDRVPLRRSTRTIRPPDYYVP